MQRNVNELTELELAQATATNYQLLMTAKNTLEILDAEVKRRVQAAQEETDDSPETT